MAAASFSSVASTPSLVQSYHPTPLEHAYANYILATYFSIAPPQYNNYNYYCSSLTNNNNYYGEFEYDKIRLSGRNAAPFLSTAMKGGGAGGGGGGGGEACGITVIHRQFLKLAWHAVDPDEIGTLTSRKQFYVLLRLIAMAQAGFFPAEVVNPSSSSSSGDVGSIIASMMRIFEQDSHLAVPPPTFAADNDNVRPSVARLLEAYPPPPPPPPPSSLPSLGYDFSSPPTTTTTSLNAIMSVHDAFDALVGDEAKDRPLPLLSAVIHANEVVVLEEDDDEPAKNGILERNEHANSFMEGEDEEAIFGSFVDVPASSPSSSSPVCPPTIIMDTARDANDNNAFVAGNADDNSLSNEPDDDEEYENTTFKGDDVPNDNVEGKSIDEAMKQNRVAHNNIIIIDGEEGLAVVVDSAVRDNVVDNDENDNFHHDCEEYDNFDEVGDFKVAPTLLSAEEESGVVVQGGGGDDDDDNDNNDTNDVYTKTTMVAIANGEIEDDITSFANDPVSNTQEEIPSSHGQDTTVAKTSITTSTNIGDNKLDNLSSAFDGLLDLEDAPLPPLESFNSTNIGDELFGRALPGNMDADADIDEFCEFEDATAGVIAEGEIELGEKDDEKYFTHHVNEPWTSNVPGTNNEDRDFRVAELDDGLIVRDILMNGEDANTLNGVSSVSDAFGGTLGAPPPNLDPILPPISLGDNVSDSFAGKLCNETKGGNDFGEFQGEEEKCGIDDNFTNFVVNGEYDTTSNGVYSVFDAFGEAPDAPLPSLDPILPLSAAERGTDNFTGAFCEEVVNDDSFGDFEGVIQKCNDDDKFDGETKNMGDSLFYPFVESNDSLHMNSVPLTTDTGNLGSREERMISKEIVGNDMKLEIPTFFDDQFDGYPQDTTFSVRLDPAASGRNESEEFCESKSALAIGGDLLGAFEDRLDFLQKGDGHDVCEQLVSVEVGVKGRHDIDVEDESFGQFEDCPEAAIHDGDEELPAYSDTSLSKRQEENETSVIDSVSAIDNDSREEKMMSKEIVGNGMKLEIPKFSDDQFVGYPQDTTSSVRLDPAASGRNESEEFSESKSALAIGRDLLGAFEDRLAILPKGDGHDVCEQLASVEVEVEGRHDIDVEDESFGQFEDCPETAIHNGDEELPAYSDTSFSKRQKENETFVIDSVSAIDNDVNSNHPETRSAISGGENGAFRQIESLLNEGRSSSNMEDCAHVEEALSSCPSQLGDISLNLENSDNPDEFDEFGNFSSFEEADHQSIDTKNDLETIICREVGPEFSKLVGFWKCIIRTVENDLQEGIKLLDRLANTMSTADRMVIIKSVKLRAFIRGLAEVVRVVRSLTASIGELLGVDKNIEVHESTLSQWNNEVIIADAIVIEFLWTQTISEAVALGIISQAPYLETVVEIRNQKTFNATEKADVCQITLQPLLDESCTKTSVTWNEKKCMACAANFCANRIPKLNLKI